MPPGSVDQENNEQLIEGNWRSSSTELSSLIPLKPIARRTSLTAKSIRDELTDFFFTNGSVPWQLDYA